LIVFYGDENVRIYTLVKIDLRLINFNIRLYVGVHIVFLLMECCIYWNFC